MVLDGEEVTFSECVERVNSGTENIDDPLQIDDELFLDLDELSRAFNHSCDPNAGLRRRSELFALRNILPAEEITYDYSSVVGLNITSDIWTMKCNCGTTACRKIIGNVLSIHEERLQAYQKAGALQDFIVTALKRTEKGRNQ